MLWKTLIFCSQLPTCWTWRHYSDTQASSTLQPEMSKPNATALVTFFALLLLTMFPQQTIAGRQYLPAGPPASSMHTPRPVQVPAARRVASQGGVLEGSALDDGSQFQVIFLSCSYWDSCHGPTLPFWSMIVEWHERTHVDSTKCYSRIPWM